MSLYRLAVPRDRNWLLRPAMHRQANPMYTTTIRTHLAISHTKPTLANTQLASTNATRAACGIPEESNAGLTPALAGSLGMLAVIMVGLRVIQRTVTRKVFGWDDVLIIFALVCAIPLNAMAFPLQKNGLGTNLWTIPFDNISTQLKLLLVAEVFYMPAEALTQLSFLAFYTRIFPPSYNLKPAIIILAGTSVAFGISNTLIMIFQCTPVSYFWQSWTGEASGSCIDISAYSWYRAAMQIVMDLSIISLPIRPVWKLALSTRKKVLVLVMFCTGFLITVVSCLRLRSLIKFSKSANISMDNNPAIYWSMVECDVAIVCACMPSIPALLKAIFPRCYGDTTHQSDEDEARNARPVPLGQIHKQSEFMILTTSQSQDQLVR
ncbi:uncharacterized protein DSM5745_10959 [Aspergillus mulundensis]|uniref:Rhodopsin domain-containing protein n=1 Tax=Aspergillus mulundensis TaxID=1810919 RepID=A0A3D8QFL3_9EURO|nr:Uncharacterized protein DSM5745_10959 [Aspergillus mulundensis]RDW60501.1 Uncharacterized protein DSM5745_10959 [Aspergillus mulundensis]